MHHDDIDGKIETQAVLLQEKIETLRVEHRALDEKAGELERHLTLTPQEQQELTRIKKRKLQLKDEIARHEHMLSQLKK